MRYPSAVVRGGAWAALAALLSPLCAAGALAAGKPPAPPRRAGPPPPTLEYNREIRPLLSRNCFACHGPDEKTRAAGLRLDERASVVSPRGGRPAVVVPGRPEASLLIRRLVEPNPARRMPPPSSGHSLTAGEVNTLRTWVAQGAPYQAHWAWQPPRAVPPPSPRDPRYARWPRNPVDNFILARLESDGRGLRPSPEADRFTLLRRVSLDLRGLPPSPAEVEAFARDPRPDAYERAVDAMLADPAYGERWARPWLDLARYADSAGYGSDPLRPNIWPYRDWVIHALNANLPYDRFTLYQLAGDLLPNPTREQLVATAFHRNTMTNTEGGTDDEEFRVAAVKDRVDTTMQVWMGVTMGCAKCHSHKYDPLSQRDYYSFFAFFNQTEDNDQPNEAPTLPLTTPEQEARLAALRAEVAALEQRAAAGEDVKTALEAKKQELSAAQPVAIPILKELPPGKRRTTRIMVKGNFLDPGEEVSPAFPAAFPPPPPDTPLNRLGVAHWLFSPQNPLTARVAVNRYWAQLFGTGLVETEEDFGTQGELPTHPELLDWLALEYRRLGWDTKRLLKLLVTSATYRQSSAVTPGLLAKDPRNRLLARAPRHRLEAETIRDQALALSGLLSRKVGGPSVYPPQPDGLWQAAFNGERTWPTSQGEDRYRRGLYTFWRRTVPYPSMAAFDAPSRELCAVRRPRTNTPLQAFVTLNDPVYVEAAQALARRLIREGGSTPAGRAEFGLRLCLVRPPAPEQVAALERLYRTEREHFAARPAEALALATEPLGPLPDGLDPAETAAWTVVANVLLNMDGVLTRQ